MFDSIVGILMSLSGPAFRWIRTKLATSHHLFPDEFTRKPDYGHPQGDPRNHIQIGPEIGFVLQWCREFKEGDPPNNKLTFHLPMGSLRFQIVGWGCLGGAGRDHFYGSVSDVGEIGTLRFSDKVGHRSRSIPVVLPSDTRQAVLRLADGNPVFSGTPLPEEVRAAGFIGRYQYPYPSTAHQYWSSANMWASEVSVPWWAKDAAIWTTEGSMHLVHVQVRKLVSPLSWLRSLLGVPEKDDEMQEETDPVKRIQDRVARIAVTERNIADSPQDDEEALYWARDLAKAGFERITGAYSPETFDRIREIRGAVADFKRAAELTESNYPHEATRFYAHAFQASLQLGLDQALFDLYPQFLTHFRACLERADARRDDLESIRCRWHIGWISLQVARLVSLFRRSELPPPEDVNLENVQRQASQECFEMYHNQIALPALRSRDSEHVETAKNRIDILVANAEELGLTAKDIEEAKGTRARLVELMK